MKPVVAVLTLGLMLSSVPSLSAQAADWASRPGQLKVETRVVTTPRGIQVTLDEGWMAVAENRSASGSRLIQVHYLRIHGTGSGVPLVYLAGGPGNVASSIVPNPARLDAFRPLLDQGDLILFDQRGTLDSDLRWQWDGPLPVDALTSEAKTIAHLKEMTRRAMADMTAKGIDLRGYTTPEAVEDLELFRRALELNPMSLLGFSYGTHYALAYLRKYSDHVANAVLVGVEGPDHTLKLPLRMDTQFRKIAAIAAADPTIASEVPDLVALWKRVAAKLDRTPMIVPVTLPGDGGTVKVPIGSYGLALLLRFDIGDATDLPVFPRLLYSIDRGDPSVLRWFVQRRAPTLLGVHLMSLMTDGAAGASPARLAAIEAETPQSMFGSVSNLPFPDLNVVLSPPPVPQDYHDPVVSTVRTLFLSGDLDWNAPAWQAEEVRFGFPNSTHLIVANAGHEQTFWQFPSGFQTALRFLAGEDVSGEVLRYRPLRFVPLAGTSSEVTHPSVRGR